MKTGRMANQAARAIVKEVESGTGVELQMFEVTNIILLVQLAINGDEKKLKAAADFLSPIPIEELS